MDTAKMQQSMERSYSDIFLTIQSLNWETRVCTSGTPTEHTAVP